MVIKKISLIIAVIFLCFAVFSDDLSAETVKMAVFRLEPFMMYDDSGGVTGIAVEYWRQYIAPRMGVELDVLGVFPIVRALALLESGEIDIIPNMTKIPEREEKFLFPETILAQIDSCLIVRPESPVSSITKPADLYGMTIGFLDAAYIPPMFIDERIKLELVQHQDYRQINLNKLWAGRLDGVLDINYISMIYYLNQKGYRERVKVIPLPTEAVHVYTVFRNTEKGRALRNRYDTVNAKGLEQGIFEKMVRSFVAEGNQ
ncbi:transporter substrate-binding domain-containing protein [Marispirochaeta aestuarii]|uniref:substrate-binding periplasmic protein n=1 Tax=Marispirochaeta aestuarii TaxID=1963862 RepID=UPI0029C8B9AF|nr:transporter substrate-binding domain-containing protein [Marispirochaeta aestuarii]